MALEYLKWESSTKRMNFFNADKLYNFYINFRYFHSNGNLLNDFQAKSIDMLATFHCFPEVSRAKFSILAIFLGSSQWYFFI